MVTFKKYLLLESSDSITLYHGTLKENLKNIMKKGLSPSSGWGGGDTYGIYLSKMPEGALYWAKIAFRVKKNEQMDLEKLERKYGKQMEENLAVLEVKIPFEALDNLRADMEQAEDYDFEGEETDWQESLEVIGDVMYDGLIPPKWLKIVSKSG
jgi:hypothetical protein